MHTGWVADSKTAWNLKPRQPKTWKPEGRATGTCEENYFGFVFVSVALTETWKRTHGMLEKGSMKEDWVMAVVSYRGGQGVGTTGDQRDGTPSPQKVRATARRTRKWVSDINSNISEKDKHVETSLTARITDRCRTFSPESTEIFSCQFPPLKLAFGCPQSWKCT